METVKPNGDTGQQPMQLEPKTEPEQPKKEAETQKDQDSKPKARTPEQIAALSSLTNAQIYSANSKLNLSVDVYHVNVEGKGDAAIHLLIVQDRAFLKPCVLRAVLIDGGTASGAERIQAVLRDKIGKLYDFDRTQGGRTAIGEQLEWPPFDSMVITHWDDDHYSGVMELVHADLSSQYASIARPAPIPNNAAADVKASHAAAEKSYEDKIANIRTSYLSPFMKYTLPSQATNSGDTGSNTGKQGNIQDNKATPVSRAERALTILYCPYFGNNKVWGGKFPSQWFQTTKVQISEGINPGPEEKGIGDGSSFLAPRGRVWPFYDDGQGTRVNDGPNLPTRFLDWNMRPEGAGRGAIDPTEWAKKMCKIRAGNQYILGTNLFTGWRLAEVQCHQVKNPMQLALAHTSADSFKEGTNKADPMLNTTTAAVVNGLPKHEPNQAQPVLLIVGANGDYCGQSLSNESTAASDTDMKDEEPVNEQEDGITDMDRFSNWAAQEPKADTTGNLAKAQAHDLRGQPKDKGDNMMMRPNDKSMDPFKFRIKVVDKATPMGGSEITNAASIITLLVWTDGHMSHYSAGDAQWEIENKIVAWIQAGQNPFQCIRAVKLSHHGATYSTPLDLVHKFRPRSIIVSASGRDYGHPVYELLLYLNRWFRTSNRIVPSGNAPGKLFHSLSYPYYLARRETQHVAEDTIKTKSTEAKGDATNTGESSQTKGAENGDTETTPQIDTKKVETIRQAIAPQYRAFGKNNFFHEMLAEKVTGVRAAYIKRLRLLENRLPQQSRSLDEFAALETIITAKVAAKEWFVVDGKISKQNFTLNTVESGMPLIAPWEPKLCTTVATVDTTLGTLQSANDKLQYVKVHCRSWSTARRAQDLDQRLDGYTTFQTSEAPLILASDSSAASRPAGKKRKAIDKSATQEERKTAELEQMQNALVKRRLVRPLRKTVEASYNNQIKGAAQEIEEIRHGPSRKRKVGQDTGDDKKRPKHKEESALEENGEAGGVSETDLRAFVLPHGAAATVPSTALSAAGDRHVQASIASVTAATNTVESSAVVGDPPSEPAADADELETWNLVSISLVTDTDTSSWKNIVPISSATSGYETLLEWIVEPIFTVDATGKADSANGFRSSLFSALDIEDEASTLTALFAANSKIQDGLWTGLSLKCKQAGHDLEFSTTSASSYFGTSFEYLPDYEVPASGIIPQHQTLILGLANNPTEKWNFTNLLTWLGILNESGTTDAISDLEDAIGTGITFDLKRGAIWFCSAEDFGVVQRMEWQLDAPAIKQWLDKGFMKLGSEITLEDPVIIGRKVVRSSETSSGLLFVDTYEFMVALKLKRPVGNTVQTLATNIQVDLENGGMAIEISLLPSSGTLGDMLGWIAGLVGADDSGGITDIVNSIPGLDKLQMKRVTLRASKRGVESFAIDLEWTPGWKTTATATEEAVEVPFLLSYKWTKAMKPNPHSIVAQVWFEPSFVRDPESAPAELSPFYEPSKVIRPMLPAPSSVSLQSLMPGDYALPKELDLEIVELVLSLEGKKVSFSGMLVASEQEDGETAEDGLGIRLEQVTVRASYERGDPPPGPSTGAAKPKGEASYELFLEGVIDISMPSNNLETDEEPDANQTLLVLGIDLQAKGKNKLCHLHGSVDNLNMGALGRFFPAEDEEIITDILGNITLESLDIDYLYGSNGAASEFDIGATLRIGPCELDLDFHRDTESWRFEALLQATEGTDATVGALLEDILDDDNAALESVPTFIKDMSLSGGNAFVSLKLASLDAASVTNTMPVSGSNEAKPEKKYLAMDLTMRLPVPGGAGVELSFIQLTEKTVVPAGQPRPLPAPGALRNKTKRIIRVSVVDLPWHKIPQPPVVGKIEPLFDELQFLWVQDPVENKGITRQELATLMEVSVIQFKESVRQPTPVDIVLAAGMHFCIADASKLLLDFAFNKPKAITPGTRNFVSKSNKAAPPSGAPVNTGSGEGTATGDLAKKVGPIAVSNVGIRFEDNVLLLFFDIAAHLGPVQVMLLGFGIGVNLKTLNLQSLASIEPQFQLKGMGVSFQQPPVGIAGMFKDASTSTQRLYMGGVAVSFKPYSFMAVGEYGEIARPGSVGMTDTYKTLFIFAKLEGPLIELEFVTIGGITLGFGYNSNLRFPTIAQVPSFPFIANTVGGENSDPLTVMNQLVGQADSYVKPQEDSFWIAAGLQAKALQILDVSAAVILEFNPYVNLGIFAKAIAQMPPAPTPRIACFIYVELGIMCTVDFHAGAFRVEAQLSPNSFVIHPSCHLTGGFALCYWFGSSPYSGDFVFTVGGYHPMYKPPPHYPIPPRLGISWQMGPVSIRGEAYFAITPQCCMGGGRLEVVFSAGLLCAYLTTYADFLIVYNPFYFMGEMGVCVGVRFTMDILFVTIHISVELNARLRLKGPEFGGSAYVDFWVFGFEVPFGAEAKRPGKKTLDEFVELLLQVPDADSVARTAIADAQATTGQIDKLHVLSVEDGRYTNKAKDAISDPGAIWEVKRAGFQFRVQSRVPLQTITQPAASDTEPDLVLLEENPFYAKPMQLTTQLVSTMTVSIAKIEKNGNNEVATFLPLPVIKSTPKALWDEYKPSTDPTSGQIKPSSLLSNSDSATMDLLMGATFCAPFPFRSYDKILKYNVLMSSSLDVFTLADVDADGKPLRPTLPSTNRFVSEQWQSAQPVEGAMQWTFVQSKWKQAVGQKVDVAEGEKSVGVVESVISTWQDAMGWNNVENGLKNDLKGDGDADKDQVLLWKQFNHLYMAAPMIGVGA
ncbi:hypothetical protein CKM354_000864800 [Cercospora kikuchii]|uniref:DUF6603 domain-containing protein n=1 Tax=Cercospora kikuchii TaxID=84275 RepID=A0A9P3FFG4_9PEZI|nr:uncharacterized protein CKM354_000864800 [Cercospora kikuchii]GIZ45483.1 hypothetical protein CKM354_000864800 [Cercospora kikuchii]